MGHIEFVLFVLQWRIKWVFQPNLRGQSVTEDQIGELDYNYHRPKNDTKQYVQKYQYTQVSFAHICAEDFNKIFTV